MRAKLIAMVLLLLLVAAPFAQIAHAGTAVTGTDQGDEDGQNSNVSDKVYEEIKAAAEARRDELLYLLELELPPDTMDKLEEALYAMDEAEETEDSREATGQYLYALKQFRNTWEKYLSHKPEAACRSRDFSPSSVCLLILESSISKKPFMRKVLEAMKKHMKMRM